MQHPPSDPASLAQPGSALTGLAKVGLVLRHHAWRQGGPHGVTPTQAEALAVLVTRGPQRVGELARALGITQPTASDALAALVRKGLVERTRDAADARAVCVSATPAGADLQTETAEWPDVLLAAVDALDVEDQASLLRGLSAIIRELQERGEIPIARMCVTCTYFRAHVHPAPDRPHHCAFVDEPFGDPALRLDCSDHEQKEVAA